MFCSFLKQMPTFYIQHTHGLLFGFHYLTSILPVRYELRTNCFLNVIMQFIIKKIVMFDSICLKLTIVIPCLTVQGSIFLFSPSPLNAFSKCYHFSRQAKTAIFFLYVCPVSGLQMMAAHILFAYFVSPSTTHHIIWIDETYKF